LDGALVTDSQAHLLAYGAVLRPKRRGNVDAEEGSRTKAAIGASYHGLAVKISADGDITAYADGQKFFRV
jgi:DNA integrity scanning protein DisA with diadenylate cyclase activity